VIAQLPELVRAAAQGLQGANVTVLNGVQGLSETVASMAAQGATILRTVFEGLGQPTTHVLGSAIDQRSAGVPPRPHPTGQIAPTTDLTQGLPPSRSSTRTAALTRGRLLLEPPVQGVMRLAKPS
jgi:hypothetical protein